MPCNLFTFDSGQTAIVCSRGSRKRVVACSTPGCAHPGTRLCDHPSYAKPDATCDRLVCETHSRTVGPDRHWCLEHGNS